MLSCIRMLRLDALVLPHTATSLPSRLLLHLPYTLLLLPLPRAPASILHAYLILTFQLASNNTHRKQPQQQPQQN